MSRLHMLTLNISRRARSSRRPRPSAHAAMADRQEQKDWRAGARAVSCGYACGVRAC